MERKSPLLKQQLQMLMAHPTLKSMKIYKMKEELSKIIDILIIVNVITSCQQKLTFLVDTRVGQGANDYGARAVGYKTKKNTSQF